MNIFPSSAGGWNTLFQTVSVILIAGTVLAGAGAIISGRIVNRNQARDIALANAEAAKANERAQELEKQNLLLQRDIMLLRLQSADPNRSQAEWDHHFSEYFRGVEDELNGRPARPRDPNPARRNVGKRTERRKLAGETLYKNAGALAIEPKGTIEIICAFDPILPGEPHEYATELAEAFRDMGLDRERSWRVGDDLAADTRA